MKALGIVIGLAAFAKGVLLLLDPGRFIRLGRQFTGLFPAPTRDVLDRGADKAFEYGRHAPGGLKTAGLLLSGSGLLVLVLALRAR